MFLLLAGGLDSSTAIRKVRGHARGADVVDVAAAHYMDLFTANGNKAVRRLQSYRALASKWYV